MKIVDKILRKIETVMYLLYLKSMRRFKKTLNRSKRDAKIIASLTSYPARFPDLYIVIESIFRQSIKPDKILLYLDKNVNENDLPNALKKLQEYGLSIIIGGENIKPHKKYYYAMKENPGCIVITFDDDNIYRRNTISRLMKSYRKYPNAVSCMRAHRMVFDNDKKLLKYNDWDLVCTEFADEPRMDLLATGVGGVLYPPNCMHNDLHRLDLIEALSLNADDIWLKIMQILNGTPVVSVTKSSRIANPLPVKSRSISALAVGNVSQSANDIYLNNLADYYGFNYYKKLYGEDDG